MKSQYMYKSYRKYSYLFMIKTCSKVGIERNHAIYHIDLPKVNFIALNDKMLETFKIRKKKGQSYHLH